jgi:hypothetical protein
MFVPGYDEDSARRAVASSRCYSEALRKLGLRPAGGNHSIFRKYVDEVWKIPTEHFDASAIRKVALRHDAIPLSAVLVEGSTYSRATLKRRLYDEGLKARRCEQCGQGEIWCGKRVSLSLDHINGVPDDNRLENLRILCPNCNAALDTHCGRKNRLPPRTRRCGLCGADFLPRTHSQKYCSRGCGQRHRNRHRKPRPDARKVERPSYEQLQLDVAELSMVAVGRKYGVSDNAVRKWLRWYAAATTADPAR